MICYKTPDLTQHPPRSPRVRLGGFAVLPRILDKARAHLAGKCGEYKWNNPLDQRLFKFMGVTAESFLAAVREGRSDTAMVEWVAAHCQPPRHEWEIAAWSDWVTNLSPGDARRHGMFVDDITQKCPKREDIRTLFDRLDMDDYVTFGGEA